MFTKLVHENRDSNTDRERNEASAAGLSETQWRELLGFDPFRRFFSNLDSEINVIRNADGFEVEIPVPGFRPEQIELTLKEYIITISGKHERRAFTRSLKVPDDIDLDKVKAHVEHGMLTLVLRRHPEAQPRRIEISPSQNSLN